jgi:hypothetical protein
VVYDVGMTSDHQANRTEDAGKPSRFVAASKEPLTKLDVARRVGPNGSVKYGYAIVDRAIRAGLLTIVPCPSRPHSMGTLVTR